jgi:RNA polymerase sigma-70 factor (ECF subfamily)
LIFLDKSSGEARHYGEGMAVDRELERLYDDHAQALFAFLLNFTRNEADTRDLLQELFVKIARQPGILDGVHEERAFLLRLAHNVAIDLMRRRTTREKHHEQLAELHDNLFAPSTDPDEQAFREAWRAPLVNCRLTSARSCT